MAMNRQRLFPVFIFLFGAWTVQAKDTDQTRLAREEMVAKQIAARGIEDSHVLRAMRAVPRHMFIPENEARFAYDDRPVPIGHGQTISQPYVVAYMTEIAGIKPDARVLEIGAGSGYQAAVLAEITQEVYTIEIVPELARWAASRLQLAGYDNVQVKQADGYYGWAEHAPFDAIMVTAAAPHIPPPLIDQLKEGGKMIIPVGNPYRVQMLVLVTKQGGEVRTQNLLPVSFVPLTGSRE